MDRKLERKPWWARRSNVAMLAAALCCAIALATYGFSRRSGLSVDQRGVSVASITRGEFQEYIALYGEAEPLQTRYLDAPLGGTVKAIYKKSGETVAAGELLLELSNPTLELDVMQRQTIMNEQLGMLSNVRLNLDSNRVTLATQLIAAENKARLHKAELERLRDIAARGLVSAKDLEIAERNYEESRVTSDIYRNALAEEKVIRNQTLADIERTKQSLRRNLEALGGLLDSLRINATESGVLDVAPLALGQAISANQRLGRIYSPSSFGVKVDVDEIYASRITPERQGSTHIDGTQYPMRVQRTHPSVQGGVFQLDMQFVSAAPESMKPGQRVEIRLELGKPEQVLRVPMGPFFGDSGGRWMFVMGEDGRSARKSAVRLGRKNPEYYEVLDGLSPGMRVIISSYAAFGSAEEINLTQADED